MTMLSSGFMTVQGMRVHYLVGGEGFPVVFLHGHGGAAWIWNVSGVLDAVAGSGYRVVAIDLPGHGESDSPAPSTDPTRPDRFIAGCMDALGIGRAVLVGGSLGGYVAANMALHQPDRVPALVLVGPAGLDRRIGFVYRLLTAPWLGEALAWPHPRMGRRGLARIVWDKKWATEEMTERWLRRRRRPGGVAEFLQMLRMGVNLSGVKRSIDLGPSLPRITQPVLLVWGTKDRVVPIAVGRKARRLLPRAEMRAVHRSGHWPYVEQRDVFLQTILPFLDIHAGRGISRTSAWRTNTGTP